MHNVCSFLITGQIVSIFLHTHDFADKKNICKIKYLTATCTMVKSYRTSSSHVHSKPPFAFITSLNSGRKFIIKNE